MNKEQRLNLMKDRYAKLINSPKAIKAGGGIARHLARRIRNMEK